MRIIFLGEQFSYHHLAAMAFWGKENDFISAPNFDTIVDKVVSGDVEYGIIAVENSLAGDVPGNFELLCKNPIEICGEITLKIELQLAAQPGTKLNQIQTVYSHKMAIRETSRFFSQYPGINFVETPSTSAAMKFVAEQKSPFLAAIGSITALHFYSLENLASEIANSRDNRTRFLVLHHKSPSGLTTKFGGKASLFLQSDKEENLNLEINELFSGCEISLIRTLKEGNVYIEILFTNNFQLDNTVREIRESGIGIRVLGVYEEGMIREGF